MKSTSSRYRDFVSRANRATLHVPADGSWASFTRRDADAQSPAGGASSNARDLAQWLRLLLANGRHDGQQLIDKAALHRRMFPHRARRRPADRRRRPSTVSAGTSIIGEHGVEWSHAGAFSAGARTRCA